MMLRYELIFSLTKNKNKLTRLIIFFSSDVILIWRAYFIFLSVNCVIAKQLIRERNVVCFPPSVRII